MHLPRPARTLLPASLSALLLAACAATPQAPDVPTAATTPPGSASAPAPATRAPTVPPPRIDNWEAERARILGALGGLETITATTRPDGTLQLLIPGAEAFGRDDAAPRQGLKATLDRIAQILAGKAETEILILGHTDSMGSELHNLQLSIRRAEAVVEYLRTRGIALTRLTADGRGEAEPVADNGTDAGRGKNRRVEIIVRPFK